MTKQYRIEHLLPPGQGFILRDYQQRAVDQVRDNIAAGKKRTGMVLATAGGKTPVNAEFTRLAVEKGKRVLFLVHRRNLVEQTRAAFAFHGVTKVGIIMAGYKPDLSLPVQLATIQTYGRRIKLDEGETVFNFPADLILVDECHRAVSKVYQDVFRHYPKATVIGCTATPMRADGRGLGEVFDSLIEVSTPAELTARGYLVPCRYFCPSKPDLEKLKVVRGDYETGELAKRMNQPKLVGDVVSNWLKHASDRKTIVFCVTVSHSQAVTAEFKRQGVSAYHLSAQSSDEEREYAFQEMERGNIQVISNVALYQEGTDVPDISCVVLARPTKSLGLYRQCVGRGLRPSADAPDCILLDHGGVVEEHGLITDPVEWVLDGKKKAWRQRKHQQEKEVKSVKCRSCDLVFRGSAKCPECGSPVQSFGKPVEAIDADLRELKPKVSMAEQRRFYGMLRHYAMQKGYDPGWCYWKYREKYGVNPLGMNDVPPVQPDDTLYRFIRHLWLKKNNGRRARNAA
ncbi:DEAD/DEAH box helicase [Desulfurivibrio sp. C05AmB]|uniref:DEAD/DEAH box helicase n=1 Tax=Desulfurivibrio sp. C05AmB TaxID=3374371 RepID=UPI00376F12A8